MGITNLYGQLKTEINIAVVRDGPTNDVQITNLIKPELEHLLSEDYSFSFIEDPRFNADWDNGNFRAVVENALNDNSIDIILGVGAMVTQEASAEDIVLTMALSSARFPAPTTIEPSGMTYSPTRLSRIKL